MKYKLISALGIILFIYVALNMINDKAFIWIIFPLTAIFTNIYALRKIKKKPEMVYLLNSVINAFFSFIVALYYLDHPFPNLKVYWLASGFMFLLIAIYFLNAAQKTYLK